MVLNFYAQLVIGPSGSGKSTYCKVIQSMSEILNRNVHIINLDPAADYLPYDPLIDVRDLITLKDVMEEYKLGPNGGLVFCIEYLLQNFDWFETELDKIAEEDYIMIDCPGQLELYSHMPTIQMFSARLIDMGFSICCVCLIDSTFIHDEYKFIGGMLMALSFIVSLNLPNICVISKCDLVSDKKILQKVVDSIAEDGYYTDDDVVEPMVDHSTSKTAFKAKYDSLVQAFKQVVSLVDRRLWIS